MGDPNTRTPSTPLRVLIPRGIKSSDFMEAITTSLASSLESASEVVIRERAGVQFAIYMPAVDGLPSLTEPEFVA